jgi:hypothetical protein
MCFELSRYIAAVFTGSILFDSGARDTVDLPKCVCGERRGSFAVSVSSRRWNDSWTPTSDSSHRVSSRSVRDS